MKAGKIYLTTSGLSIGYKHHRKENLLFENLNLSIRGGQMICFMGPNGSGKSSLLRTLSGLQRPLSGKIGLYPAPGSEGTAREIAVVLTDRINTPNLTVEEVVTFGRYPYLGWNIRL